MAVKAARFLCTHHMHYILVTKYVNKNPQRYSKPLVGKMPPKRSQYHMTVHWYHVTMHLGIM